MAHTRMASYQLEHLIAVFILVFSHEFSEIAPLAYTNVAYHINAD